MSCADLFLAFIAILFPPIAVWIKSGLCTADSFINIALCCLGYVPGLIHAWYIIARNPDPMDEYEPIHDSERAGAGDRVTYYYITHDQQGQQQQSQRGYGTPASRKPAPAPAPSSAPGAQFPTTGGSGDVGPSQPGGGEQAGAPPSYTDAVKGDHKVQTRD